MTAFLHVLFPDVTVWDWRAYVVAGLVGLIISIGLLLMLNGLRR